MIFFYRWAKRTDVLPGGGLWNRGEGRPAQRLEALCAAGRAQWFFATGQSNQRRQRRGKNRFPDAVREEWI